MIMIAIWVKNTVKKYSLTDVCFGPGDSPLREVLIPVPWAHWGRFRGFCKVTWWVCQPLTSGFWNLCSQSLSDSLNRPCLRGCLGPLGPGKNYANEEQLPLTPKLLQLSLCSLFISSHFPQWSEKEMIGEVITLETLTHALSFLSYTLWLVSVVALGQPLSSPGVMIHLLRISAIAWKGYYFFLTS